MHAKILICFVPRPGKGRHRSDPLIFPYCSLGLVWQEFDRRVFTLSTKLFLWVGFECLTDLKMRAWEEGRVGGLREKGNLTFMAVATEFRAEAPKNILQIFAGYS